MILLSIRKNDNYHLNFQRFRGEICPNYININAQAIQNSYQLEKIEDNSKVNYLLKSDNKFSNYIRTQFQQIVNMLISQ